MAIRSATHFPGRGWLALSGFRQKQVEARCPCGKPTSIRVSFPVNEPLLSMNMCRTSITVVIPEERMWRPRPQSSRSLRNDRATEGRVGHWGRKVRLPEGRVLGAPAFSAGSRSGWLIYYRPCLRAVVMYRYENWTVKKFEHERIDAFELWCWRRLVRVPWTARRSNLSILKEISPEYSFERLMLKLKL